MLEGVIMNYSQESITDFSPESWGWKREFHAAWMALVDSNPGFRAFSPARVTGREHHRYEIVRPDFRSLAGFASLSGEPARFGFSVGVPVSGRFEYGATGPADYPVIGDWVLVEAENESLRIQGVLARRSALSRGSAGPICDEQVLAANVDVIFLVFALDGGRNFLLRFLERALIVAKNSGAACCIVLNKADLATAEERERSLFDARRAAPHLPVVALSAKTGEGVGDLSAIISPGETGCVLGKSGVGKSALVNALARRADSTGAMDLDGAADLAREGAVRGDDLRGRHTTTSSHLYRLESGLLMIDSPGIRELKIWGDADALEGGFPEIGELALSCRFSDCSHAEEPGCAVREALVSGALDPARYRAYLDLSKEQAWLERRNDDRARRADDHKWKQISKAQKELKKNGR